MLVGKLNRHQVWQYEMDFTCVFLPLLFAFSTSPIKTNLEMGNSTEEFIK